MHLFHFRKEQPNIGIISLGSVTKEQIFPTIWAAFFLVSALLSLNPLCTIGTNNASDGASIGLLKVVCKINRSLEWQKRTQSFSQKRENNQNWYFSGSESYLEENIKGIFCIVTGICKTHKKSRDKWRYFWIFYYTHDLKE